MREYELRSASELNKIVLQVFKNSLRCSDRREVLAGTEDLDACLPEVLGGGSSQARLVAWRLCGTKQDLIRPQR